MLVYGVGKPIPKKNNEKFDSALLENEKLLSNILQKADAKDAYTTISTITLSSITLNSNPAFISLKAEIELFNDEVKKALETKSIIPNYKWKYSLCLGLRNLLQEIVSTEDKNLKIAFLEKAKAWFFDKMTKKGELDNSKTSARPQTNQSLRPMTANTRPFTANTRPFTSQTNRMSDINQMSVNISGIPPDGKSFFENTQEDILPSKLRADILRDYEDGARSKHDLVEPPYDRLSEYERKLPQGILKPSSRVGARPATSKTTTFAREKDLPSFMSRFNPQASTLQQEEELSQPEGSRKSFGEEGGEVEGEGEAEAENAGPPKPGIVVPARKLYMNDKTTGFEQKIKDVNIPMEARSNQAHYVPGNSLAELKLEQRWRNAMHKKTVQKREKEEFITIMKEWSHTKSRLEEEIGRKNESNTYGSRFQTRAFIPRAKSASLPSALPRSFSQKSQIQEAQNENEEDEDLDIKDEDEISERSDEDAEESAGLARPATVYRETGAKKVGRGELIDYTKVRPRSVATGHEVQPLKTEPLEDKMNKAKIDRITRLHADLLFASRNVPVDVGQDGAYRVDRPTSLSVYDQTQMPKYRPFSAVYQSAKPEVTRKSQMQEIEEVKAKLAKFKIKVPAKQLKNSLLLPELTKESHSKLPEPGGSLLMNPFFKEKKGKKKKKRSKK